jgi:hypothetical protein
MTGNTESPSTTITGSATLTRTWYGQVRSVLGKPHVALMSGEHDPASISDPSQPVGSLLGTIPSLRFATPVGLRDLAAVTRRESVARGDAMTQQGEPSFDVFFIIDGTFDVSISHFGHTPDFIRTLGAGDSFGELGVLYAVPRTATVRCTSAGHILRIPGHAFLDALDTGS